MDLDIYGNRTILWQGATSMDFLRLSLQDTQEQCEALRWGRVDGWSSKQREREGNWRKIRRTETQQRPLARSIQLLLRVAAGICLLPYLGFLPNNEVFRF